MTMFFSPANAAIATTTKSSYMIGMNPFNVTPMAYSACSLTDTQTIRFVVSEGSDGTVLNFAAIPNLKKLLEIEKLENNWNGYGARKLNSTVINNAKTMLLALKQQPFVSPTARQSVQMEYDRENGDYFEIEIFADSIDVYTVIDSREEEYTFEVNAASYERIAEMAGQFNG